MDANLLSILLSFSGFVLVVIGFVRLVIRSKSEVLPNESITVVLPFRNEELHHKLMLERLKNTSLQPLDLWVFVDDGSRINWAPELPEFASVYSLSDQGGSKKVALQYAIQRSETPIICTTDADCDNQANWILSMRQACSASTNLVIGPVLMKPGNALVSQIASLESIVLMSVTMGTAAFKVPLMCSGANLLFRKSAWQDVGGYTDHINQSSGDDVLLMHSIWLKNNQSVEAQVNPDALMITEAPKSWTEFLIQRKRWASKVAHILHYKKVLLSLLMIFWATAPWFLWAFSWLGFITLTAVEVIWMLWITQFYKTEFRLISWLVFRMSYPILFVVLLFVPPGKWKQT